MRAKRIYLDHAAGTPLDAEVFSSMKKVFSAVHGNPSSIHADGVHARTLIEEARKKIAETIQAQPDEVIFTSGGTEANNLAILGVAHAARAARTGNHLIISSFEHHSIIGPARALESEGFEVTHINPNRHGIVDPREIIDAIRPETILVSIMYANNEIGTIQPIREIAKALRRVRAQRTDASPLMHTDACQATGNLPLSVITLGIDLMTINAHKAYGPRGVGVLYAKRTVKLAPIVFGGGQERSFRSGTENSAAIIGFAAALAKAERMRVEETQRLTSLREYLWECIAKEIPHVDLNGDPVLRLPGNLNVSFLGIDSEQLVIELDAKGVSVSSGSACTSSDLESSYVILSLGKSADYANSAVRFSLGRSTTKADIDALMRFLPKITHKLRRFSAFA